MLPPDPANYNLDTILNFIPLVIQFALGLSGAVAVLYVIIGAYSYLTAYGDAEKANSGKQTLTYAIIGLIVIASAELIVALMWRFFSGSALPTIP